MKKKLFLVYIITSLSISAQTNGDSLRRKGDLEGAIKAYKKSLKTATDVYKNNYNIACIYAIMFNKDSAFQYLKIALKNNKSLWALADNDLYSLTNDKRWETIENQQLEKYQTEKGKIQKPEFAKQLLRLIMKDQSLDYQLDMAKDYFFKTGKAPHWYYPIAQMKQEITEGNFKKMEALIQENGWPTYTNVGKLAADSPLLVINHHPKEAVRIKYLQQIKETCLENEGSCFEYAKIQDRILVNTEKSQLFGMQLTYNKDRNRIPFPILKPEFVDKRRSEIGLEPLKKYLKRKINYEFTVKQEK
ncbi:MAG: tetratricopeptide (TPR) repeat protein [Polaribacter sp.]|jgi:tetratricopeptide (TPR) repeat protein